MRILDRYIIQKFLAVLFYGCAGFIVIFVVIDLIENLDKFLTNDAAITDVILYYIYFIPYIVSLTLPISMLMSSLFALGSMAQHNELIATLSSGVSLYRIITPLLILAFAISIGAGYFNESLVPQTNKLRLDIMRYEVRKQPRQTVGTRRQIAVQDRDHRQMNIRYYDGRRRRINKVNVIKIISNKVVERWDAETMTWDTLSGEWLMQNVSRRQFTDSTETLVHLDSLWYANSQVHPDDLFELQEKPEEMNYADLKAFIDRNIELGADVRQWLVDLYMKVSYPLANFIIVLFGAPLAARKRRGGPALGFALALLICFIYFLFIRTGQVLGHNGTLNPWLGAWIGNAVFFVAGLFTMFRARK